MRKSARFKMTRRRGASTLDYVLVLGVILPLAAFLFRVGPKIIEWRMKWCVFWCLGHLCRSARAQESDW